MTLPDGTKFQSAGRIDWFNHPAGYVALGPDSGHAGNIAALCAALAPPPMTPTSGPAAGGTVVTLTGSGFTVATSVAAGGVTGSATNAAPNGSSLTFVAPAGTAGTCVPVSTTNPTLSFGNFCNT